MSIRNVIENLLANDTQLPFSISPRRQLFAKFVTAAVLANTSIGTGVTATFPDTFQPNDAFYIESWTVQVNGSNNGSWTLQGGQFAIVNNVASNLLFIGQPSTTVITSIATTLENIIPVPLIFRQDVVNFAQLQALSAAQPWGLSSGMVILNGSVQQAFGISSYILYRFISGLQDA